MKKIVYLLLTAAFITGCNPNDDAGWNPSAAPVTDEQFAQNFGSEVQRDFIGQVIDVNKNPIQNATVKIGSATVQTDANGVFIINAATVHEKFAYITAAKAGFIDGSRSLVPTIGKNNISIMLLPSTPVATIVSGTPAAVDLPNGTKIDFDGAFEDANGNAYSGDVSVSVFHLESSDVNIGALMPGMLYAKSESGQAVGLQTFGMLHAELRGSGGQKLQIASGHTAEITMKIDEAQLATAPATIPLWHFDEANGYWKQEGSATKQGNQYVGTVSHFSWWNCDALFEVITLGVFVKNEAGIGLNNVEVTIVSGDTIASAYTNITGEINGLAPANRQLTIIVRDVCGNTIESFQAGPFSATTQLPDIVLADDVVTTKKIVGSLVKCDNTPVTNGYLMIEAGAQSQFVPITSGDFSCEMLACNLSNSFTVQGYDFDALQTTGEIYQLFTSAAIQNVGDVQACNAITEFISYDFDGEHFFLPVIGPGQINESGSFAYTIRGNVPGDNAQIFLYSNATTPGVYSYNVVNLWVTRGNTTYHCTGLFPGNTVSFTLNHCGAVGEYIDMNFGGVFYTGVGGVDMHTISGVAHVKRRPQL